MRGIAAPVRERCRRAPLVAAGRVFAQLQMRQAICMTRSSLHPCVLLHLCTHAVPSTQGPWRALARGRPSGIFLLADCGEPVPECKQRRILRT